MTQAKKYGNIIAITAVGVAVVLLMVMIFLFNYKMNSDIGAEAVLGRLIWDSKEIIPTSWYPSTETRIIATPQAAALFYGLTGNMDLSMGLACCTMTIGIILAIWLFMKKAGSSRISCLILSWSCRKYNNPGASLCICRILCHSCDSLLFYYELLQLFASERMEKE